MMRVTDQLAIRAQDLSWRFVRAPGPGGQNANKVATAVELRFDTHSPALPEPVRLRLRALAGRRIGKHGTLLIEACRHRTQALNRQDALARLWGLLSQAAATPKRRIATRPSASSRRLRVENKRRQAAKKQSRQSPGRRTPFAER
jgi:ribosome-associated protein